MSVAIDLARRAGAEIMAVYGGGFSVEQKEGGEGPVTLADLRADALIRQGLQNAFPEDAVLSEETPDDLQRLGCSRLWLVDPLDGTHQFVTHLNEFAVMIGLAIQGVSSLGVIFLPAEGRMLAGAVGMGAFEVLAGGERIPVRIDPEPPSGRNLALAISRAHALVRTLPVVKRLNPDVLMRSGSVGRKAALILEGRADVYLSLGRRSRHWDSCGPQAVIEAAEGIFCDAWGRPLRYNTDRTKNTEGLLACRPGLLPRVVRAVKDVWGALPEEP